jgi:prevent-host-death family protein
MPKTWRLQEAKNQFSAVVERALRQGYQVVTRHGRPTVVVISVEEFMRLKPRSQPLSRFLAESPLGELGVGPARNSDLPREVPL